MYSRIISTLLVELPLHTLIELEGPTEVSNANASFYRSIFGTYMESDNKEPLIFLVFSFGSKPGCVAI